MFYGTEFITVAILVKKKINVCVLCRIPLKGRKRSKQKLRVASRTRPPAGFFPLSLRFLAQCSSGRDNCSAFFGVKPRNMRVFSPAV